MKKTKIVCTLGPASTNEKVIAEMLKNGMNVARLNFSHGTHEEHAKTIAMFRRVRDRLKMPAAVMLDTKGPEIRLGNFSGDGKVTLTEGELFTLTNRDILGDGTQVSMTYANLPNELNAGDRVLIDDGRVILTVESTNETDVVCRVTVGGQISNHKGINLPNIHLNMPFMSPRDEADLRFGIEHDVDFVAASFVRCKEDVIAMRRFLDYYGGHNIRIIAKIENNEGVENFEEILAHADGIMVARGDMGVEVEFERLPGIQKRFIRACYRSGKMVITATQMLESMIHSMTPTRAEISDVANAVFDGSSAVMLSGETAAGKYPVEAVATMAQIAEFTEQHTSYKERFYKNDFRISNNLDAISHATCAMAIDVNAKAIVVCSVSGKTARMVSRFRCPTDIVGMTVDEKAWRKLNLSWGVTPVLASEFSSMDVMFYYGLENAKKYMHLQSGDCVVITGGPINGKTGNTNTIKVETV